MAADDGQVRIGISIDASGVEAGKSQAQGAADAITAAYDKVAAAALEAANAQKQHSQILSNYNKQTIDQSLAESALSANLERTSAASQALGAARAELKEITDSLNESENEENETLARGISGRQSATASIGLLEGRMMSGNRAAGAFLANVLGLGPALQAAFPVIGAIALLGVLIDVVKNAEKFAQDAADLGNELGTGWLDGAVGQITGLAAAVKQADAEIMKLAADNDAAKTRIQAANAEYDRATKGVKVGDTDRANELQKRIDSLEAGRKLDYQAAAEHGRNAESPIFTDQHGSQGVDDERKQQDVNLAQARSKEVEEQDLIREKANLIVDAKKQDVEYSRAIAEATIEASHAFDSQLDASDQINAHLREQQQLHRAEQEYAAPGTAEAGPQLRALRDQISLGQAAREAAEEAHETGIRQIEEADKAQRDAYAEERRDQESAAEAWRKQHEERLKSIEEEAKAEIKKNDALKAEGDRVIAYREKLGAGAVHPEQSGAQIDDRYSFRMGDAAQRKLDVSQTTENEQVGALRSAQSQLSPETNGQDLTQYKKIQDEITEIQEKGRNDREQIAEQEALHIVQVYNKETQQINSALISGLNQWMTTSKKFGDAMADAGKKMAVEFIDQIATMVMKWAEHEVMMTVLHTLGITQRKAADTAGATEAATASAAAATKQILTNVALAQSSAGVAAAEAAAEAAPAGPEAAVAAGAAMLAAMAPFVVAASMEQGGIVPGRSGSAVPIMAHANEAVLPAPLTSMLVRAAGDGSGGGAPHRFTSVYSPQISVLDSRGLEAYARRAGDVHGREMTRYARRLNLIN